MSDLCDPLRLIEEEIAGFRASALVEFSSWAPWDLTQRAIGIIDKLIWQLDSGYKVTAGIAVHRTATVENGAIVKSPAIIGPRCFVASGAYLRGGCWLEQECIIGPGAELKSSFVFAGSKLAHFNFVGDSILGREVNLEAGSIIANYRNEWTNSTIAFVYHGQRIDTGVEKFGALVGDRARIGANAVIAPGAILPQETIVNRLTLIDQTPASPA